MRKKEKHNIQRKKRKTMFEKDINKKNIQRSKQSKGKYSERAKCRV